APSRSMRSVAVARRPPARSAIDLSSRNPAPRRSGHQRWHSSLFSWSKYLAPTPSPPDPATMGVTRFFLRRGFRFVFRLLFVLPAVVGGAIVVLALVAYVGWRLLPVYGKSVPDKALLTLDIGDGVVEREPGDLIDRLAQGRAMPMRTITVALEAAG